MPNPNWIERPYRPGTGIPKEAHVVGIGRRVVDGDLVREIGDLVNAFRRYEQNAEIVDPPGIRYITRRELAAATFPVVDPRSGNVLERPHGMSIRPRKRLRPNPYKGSPLSGVPWVADDLMKREVQRGDPMLRAQISVRVGEPEWRQTIAGYDTEDDRWVLRSVFGYTLVLPISDASDLQRIREDQSHFDPYRWRNESDPPRQRLGGIALFTVSWPSKSRVPDVSEMPDLREQSQSWQNPVPLSPVEILKANDQS